MKELSIEEKAKAYDEALEIARDYHKANKILAKCDENNVLEDIFPELAESEDELTWLTKYIEEEAYYLSIDIRGDEDRVKLKKLQQSLAWLEKQGEQNPTKNFVETWKDMRLEVYQQASGNRHEPNCSDDTTKMFSLNDIDEIIEKMSEQKFPNKVEPKFKVGDIIEYVGERKELIDGKYEIKEIGNDFYVATSGTIIPFKFEKYYINKTEPKFKVEEGKWYICTQTFVLRGKIVVIKGQVYQAQENSAIKGEEGCLFVDKHDGKASEYFRLWTIQDAKDGDVLIDEDIDVIGIFEGIEGMCWHSKFYYSNTTKELYGVECGGSHQKEFAKPATKEQRDLLFQKMKEAGYEWDTEKKELKLLITNGGDFDSKNCEWNPAWSKEDEQNLNVVLSFVADEHLRRWLKDVIHTKYDKPAWSDEDEKRIKRVIYILSLDGRISNEELKDIFNLLKSLRPQKQWKPSNEQMHAFEHFVRSIGESGYASPYENNTKLLYSLLNDLKKLKA